MAPSVVGQNSKRFSNHMVTKEFFLILVALVTSGLSALTTTRSSRLCSSLLFPLNFSRVFGANNNNAITSKHNFPQQAKKDIFKALDETRRFHRSANALYAENPKEVNGLNTTITSDMEVKNEKKLWKQFQMFKQMALPYYKESKSGRRLFVGMIGLTLLNSGVSVAFSYLGRGFWNALSRKDATQFYRMLWKYVPAVLVGSPVSVLYRYQREKLAIAWREWMTDRTFQLYSSNRVYYALERQSSSSKKTEIDNPDQRIAEDVHSFTQFSLQLFVTIITSVIDLVSFSVILYSIQPRLFGVIAIYAGFGTIATTALGRKLVKLNFEKLVKEANFRYSLVRIRDNAESIAFYAGEDLEGKEVSKRLDKVVDNCRSVILAQRNLEFFTKSYNYFSQFLPVCVIAPQYFKGIVPLGVVSQSAGAFHHILGDLSVVVNQFEQLSSFSAAIDRLSQFMSAVRDADDGRSNDSELMMSANATQTEQGLKTNMDSDDAAKSKIRLHQRMPLPNFSSTIAEEDRSVLSFKNLTLTTPDRKRQLIDGLDLSIREGENLLIVGSSGAGKSSLLRAIAGLWTAGDGSISRPLDEDVYFLPQRPYCALGSLRDQLLYPSTDEMDPDGDPEDHRMNKSRLLRQSMSDHDLLSIFEQVDLKDLPFQAGDGDPIQGLNSVMDWSNTLSLGEQQRLAFGRLLVNQPRFVVLDEATSALDLAAEFKMYKLLQDMAQRSINGEGGSPRTGLTYVSVGHRPSLMAYHDTKLSLNEGENHSIEPIKMSTARSRQLGFTKR